MSEFENTSPRPATRLRSIHGPEILVADNELVRPLNPHIVFVV